MSKLIVHIGAAKCGSSSIQKMLADNHQILDNRGLFSPNNDFDVGPPFTGTQLWTIEASKGKPSELQDAFTYLASLEYDYIVVSAENICNHPQFVEFFVKQKMNFSDVEIVFYVRRQDDFLVSAWQQWGVKQNKPFHKWFKGVIGKMGNWVQVIRPWINELKVHLRPFPMLYKNDVCFDFLNLLGISDDGIVVSRHNLALKDEIVALAESNNLFPSVNDQKFYDFIVKTLGPQAFRRGPSSLLTLDQRNKIYDQYLPGNNELQKLLLPELSGPLFPRPSEKDVAVLTPLQKVMRQQKLLAKILFKMGK